MSPKRNTIKGDSEWSLEYQKTTTTGPLSTVFEDKRLESKTEDAAAIEAYMWLEEVNRNNEDTVYHGHRLIQKYTILLTWAMDNIRNSEEWHKHLRKIIEKDGTSMGHALRTFMNDLKKA